MRPLNPRRQAVLLAAADGLLERRHWDYYITTDRLPLTQPAHAVSATVYALADDKLLTLYTDGRVEVVGRGRQIVRELREREEERSNVHHS